MMKEKLLRNIFQWGVLAAIVVVATPDLALAAGGNGFGQAVADFRTTDVNKVAPFVSAIAYIVGAVLAVSGALKLKAHAEKPDQEKIGPGIARLLAGGAVAALPAVVGTASATLHLDSATVTYNPITNIPG